MQRTQVLAKPAKIANFPFPRRIIRDLGTIHVTFIVAVTHPHQEARVADRIRDAGYEVFFPREKKLTISRGRRRVRMFPLFPRYLMIRQQCDVAEVAHMRDVVQVLMTANNVPATIPDRVVADLRSWLADDVLFEQKKIAGLFLPGERVTPKSGPLQWHIGVVEKAQSHNRVVAFFFLMGRELRFTFKRSDLIAA